MSSSKLLSKERIGREPFRQLPVNFNSARVCTKNEEDRGNAHKLDKYHSSHEISRSGLAGFEPSRDTDLPSFALAMREIEDKEAHLRSTSNSCNFSSQPFPASEKTAEETRTYI